MLMNGGISTSSEDWYDIETMYVLDALDEDLESVPPGEILPPRVP